MSRFTKIAVLATALLLTSIGAKERASLEHGEILVDAERVEGSDLPRIIVKGIVDAPPEKVWEIVSDCDVYERRLPRIREGRVVERSGNTVICELTVALPFPLSDMTARTKAKHIEGPPRWSRTWTLLEGDYETNEGSWVIEGYGEEGNRCLVTYSVHAVPSGSVPSWAQRRAQQSSMPGIIERLREETASER